MRHGGLPVKGVRQQFPGDGGEYRIMPRFFTEEFTGDRSCAIVSGEDAVHIARVLRMGEGDSITLCDKASTDYFGTIRSADSKQVVVDILESRPSAGEPDVRVALFQAVPKGDKMELIVQKAVELGVFCIVPVLTRRCVARPDEKAWARKRERLQKIACEAAKQCGRGIIPQVGELLNLERALEQMAGYDLSILFYEQSRQPLAPLLQDGWQSAAMLVGSEGGFDPEEAEQARRFGIWEASLGSRILRCETAPIAALSALMFQSGNL